MKRFFFDAAAGLALCCLIVSCGYTQKTTLPKDIKSIHIDTVINSIPVQEVYAYQAGLEMDITQAIIQQVQEDGNLKVAEKENADAILESHLVGFEQGGVRFNQLERVEEFRLYVILALRLIDGNTGETIWEEPSFSGDAEYFVSGVRSTAREEASRRAIDRLARNVVDRIVEDW
ncbi:MAG: hypothetical protein A2Z83_07570 [Omnitrophica bacterium GWA2_52_8]|nr:MAG: hypothetical protein A2Z83_07570 [Omnitrophica bacterium GWA2_52_8]